MSHSREYLEEALKRVKQYLPGWQYALLVQSARASAGGRGKARVDEPGIFEKLALAEIKPARLREVGDEELDAIWLRLHQWYANAQRRRQAVEDFVNAALWVKAERERRGRKTERTDLVRAVEALESLLKARRDSVRGKKGELPKFIGERLEKIPEEILLCRDWVSIAGSAAVAEKPGDVDVVIRSSYDTKEGTYGIDGRSLGVALRRFLSPNKRGPQVQLIDAPQGSFTDYIPMFDLVVRRREPHVEKIECTPPEYEERERVIKFAKPFRSPGGKDVWAPWITSQIPKHSVYVEPYAGSASVFFYKKPSEKEVLCDINPDIIGTLKFLKEGSDADFEWMRKQNWQWSPAHFEKVKKSSPSDLRGRAYRYKYLNLFSVRGRGHTTTDKYATNTGKVFLGGLEKFRDRLKGTTLICGDAIGVMKKFDSSITFQYIDPPWQVESKSPEWKDFDAKAFGRALADLKSKTLVSYQGTLELPERWSQSTKTMRQGGFNPDSKQNIYRNYSKVEKQARAATAELRAQAERSKNNDELVPGHFFYQPKPTRPAFAEEPQTVERLVELYTERAEKWLPAWVQKKYDGANHQIHKVGSDVTILSEDGDDNTDRLPGLVAEVEKLPVGNAVLVAELERWEGDKHLPREAVAGYLASKDEPDDSDLVANVYDVLWWKGDVHGKPLQSRIEILKRIGTGTMGKPDLKRRINIAPGEMAKSPEEIKTAVEKIRKLPGSEGIVAKRLLSPYRLDHVTGDDWVKFHNAVLFTAQVTKANRTKGGVWTYSYAVKPGKDTPATLTPDKLVPVGETFSTGRRLRPGDLVRIEAETVNKMIGPQGVALTAWVPRVLGDADGELDTVDDIVKRAADELVLRVKEIDERGEIKEYLPANVIKAMRPEVPTVGPKGAKIAFIGASPGKAEAARREPFVGQPGETFNDVYLKPLGLKRDDVVLTNAVPVLLEDDEGKVRQPTVEEIKEWRDWLHEQLVEKAPKIIVALGRTAESAIADHHKIDFVLPHPSAVQRFGDSGEVKRKLRQIRERLVEKQLPKPLLRPMAEGGTRAAAAFDHWDRDWAQALPRTGKGRFVYQHHWRGLEEEETKQTDEQLLKSDHSLHGDLRLQGNGDELWGFSVFLGRTEDNRGREKGDKLIGWKAGDNIEMAPKLAQPQAWLDVGEGRGLVTGPGEVGATAEKFSKFFKLDGGEYEMGVARQHAVEIFLDGEHLKGRYLILFAPVGGRRRWLIDKPEDQTPWAESRDLADVTSELKRKRQRWLYWSQPGDRPQLIDVRSGKVVSKSVSIAKADELKRIVYGVVLDPYGSGQPDAHNDWTPPEEIEKTAHRYLESSRVVGLQHKKKADAVVVESWVEPYPSREDYKKALRGEPHRVYRRKFGDDFIHSGSWLMGVRLNKELWEMFEDGKITAFSPGGIGLRRKIRPSDFPKISLVELVEKPA